MKKIKNYIIILLLSLLIIPLNIVNAVDIETSTEEKLNEKDGFDKYFDADNTITVEKEINHNYFVAGNNVNDKSTTNGIMFAAANNLNSNSKIDYAFMFANTANITSLIENDLFLLANNINIIDTAITRDAYILGNQINISNTTIGNNVALSGSVIKLNNITINGNLEIDASEIIIEQNVTITGTIRYNETAKTQNIENVSSKETKTYKVETISKKEKIINEIKDVSISIIALIVTTIFIYIIFPKSTKLIDKKITKKEIGLRISKGLVILIITPIIGFLLLISTIAYPLGIITLLLYGILIYLSIIIPSILIGDYVITKLIKKEENIYLSIILGIIIVKVISLIPFIGTVLYFLTMLYGIGQIYELINNSRETKK